MAAADSPNHFLALFSGHIHNDNSAVVQQQLLNLHNNAPQNSFDFNSTYFVGEFKYLARRHGLPREISLVLVSALQDVIPARNKAQIATAVRYACVHDSNFLSLDDVFSCFPTTLKSPPIDDTGYFEQETLKQLCLAFALALPTHGYDNKQEQRFREKYLKLMVDSRCKEEIEGRLASWRLQQKRVHLDTFDGESWNEADVGEMEDKLFYVDGETLLRKELDNGGFGLKQVRADIVQTQHSIVSSMTSQNISEKTAIQAISLSNALNTSRSRASDEERTKVKVAQQQNSSKRGTDRSWFLPTGLDVKKLREKALKGKPIKDNDLVWLKKKTRPGLHLTDILVDEEIMTAIGDIFWRVSEYQSIKDDIMVAVTKNVFGAKNEICYSNCRSKLLMAIRNHAFRNDGKLSEPLHKILEEFRPAPGCTSDLKRLLWKVFVLDSLNLRTNFSSALQMVAHPHSNPLHELQEKLEYIGKHVAIESLCGKLQEEHNFFDKLTRVVQDLAGTYPPILRVMAAEIIDGALQDLPIEALSDEVLLKFVELYTELDGKGVAEPDQPIDQVTDIPTRTTCPSTKVDHSERTQQSPWLRMKAHRVPREAGGLPPPATFASLVKIEWTQDQGKQFQTSLLRSILLTLDKLREGDPSPPPMVLQFLLQRSTRGTDPKLEALIVVSLSNLILKYISTLSISGAGCLVGKLFQTTYIDESGQAHLNPEDLQLASQSGVKYISTLVAHIIHRSVSLTIKETKNQKSFIDKSLIRAVIKAVSVPKLHLTTRIICAEILFEISMVQIIDPNLLSVIRPFTLDPVTDIRLHCSSVFCTQLAHSWQSVGEQHLDWLPKLYSFNQELMLEGRDFAECINPPILVILNRMAGTCEFSLEIIQLVTLVLNGQLRGGEVTTDVLSTIRKHVCSETIINSLPKFCFEAVQNTFLEFGWNEDAALIIYESMSRYGLPVSGLLLDHAQSCLLRMEALDEVRFALVLLFTANLNQDMDDTLFQCTDMLFMGYRLLSLWQHTGRSNWLNPTLLSLLQICTELRLDFANITNDSFRWVNACTVRSMLAYVAAGLKMSPLNLQVAEIMVRSRMCWTEIIQCLLRAAENEQTFGQTLIDASLGEFTSTSTLATETECFDHTDFKGHFSNNLLMINLANCFANNYQTLPSRFIEQLVLAFCSEEIDEVQNSELFEWQQLERKEAQRLLTILAKQIQLPKLDVLVLRFCKLWSMTLYNNENLMLTIRGFRCTPFNSVRQIEVARRICEYWRKKHGVTHRLEILNALTGIVNKQQQKLGIESTTIIRTVFAGALRHSTHRVQESGIHGMVALSRYTTMHCRPDDFEVMLAIQMSIDCLPATGETVRQFLSQHEQQLPHKVKVQHFFIMDVLNSTLDKFVSSLEDVLGIERFECGDQDDLAAKKQLDSECQDPNTNFANGWECMKTDENGNENDLLSGSSWGVDEVGENDSDSERQVGSSRSSSLSEDSYDRYEVGMDVLPQHSGIPVTTTPNPAPRDGFTYGRMQSIEDEGQQTKLKQEKLAANFRFLVKVQNGPEIEMEMLREVGRGFIQSERCQERLVKILSGDDDQPLPTVKRAIRVLAAYPTKGNFSSRIVDAVGLTKLKYSDCGIIQEYCTCILDQLIIEGVPATKDLVRYLETDLSCSNMLLLLRVLKTQKSEFISDALKPQLYLYEFLLQYTARKPEESGRDFRSEFLKLTEQLTVINLEIIFILLRVPVEQLFSIPETVNLITSSLLAKRPSQPQPQPLNRKLVTFVEAAIDRYSSEFGAQIFAAYSTVVEYCTDKNKMLQTLSRSFQDNPAEHQPILVCLVTLIKICEPRQVPVETVHLLLEQLQSPQPEIRHSAHDALTWLQNDDSLMNESLSALPLLTKNIFIQIFESEEEAIAELERDEKFAGNLLLFLYSLRYWDLNIVRRFKNDRDKWCEALSISNWVACFASSEDEKIQLALSLVKLYKGMGFQSAHLLVAKIASKHKHRDDYKSFLQSLAYASQLSVAQALDALTRCTNEDNCDTLAATLVAELVKSKLNTQTQTLPDQLVTHAATNLFIEAAGSEIALTVVEAVDSIVDATTLVQLAAVLNNSDWNPKDVVLLATDGGVGKWKNLKQFCVALQVQLLLNQLPTKQQNSKRLKRLLKGCILQGISAPQIGELIQICTSYTGDKVVHFQRFFQHIVSQLFAFGADPRTFNQILNSLKNSKLQNTTDGIAICSKILNGKAFGSESNEKDVRQIVEEFGSVNNMNLDPEEMKELIEDMKMIEEGGMASRFVCDRYGTPIPIHEWRRGQITHWANVMKAGRNEGLTARKALSIAYQGMRLTKNLRLKPTQILAILRGEKGIKQAKGLLQQVGTGSGKSAIIAVLAVMACLMRGFKVDVYTSTNILAERDAKEWKSFYALFGLTCDHNGDRTNSDISGGKSCYKRDVLYGDCAQFQFDMLRHTYSDLGTRGERCCELAIVDEVDSMFIDDSSKLARLSSTLPGMDQLHIIYHFIWDRLTYLKTHLFKLWDSMYFFDGETTTVVTGTGPGQIRITYKYADENSDSLKTIDDIIVYILGGGDLEKARIYRINELKYFVMGHLIHYANKIITPKSDISGGIQGSKAKGPASTQDHVPLVELPKALLKFAESQITKWVDSALTALLYQENTHYIVDGGQIKPVDFRSTGVVQSCTSWNNGLHQFLQIKHKLRLTSEAVTTNFMSNIAMFSKYGLNLIGFTGTLGSECARKVLAEVYNAGLLEIPGMHTKRYVEFPKVLVSEEQTWLEEIVASSLEEARKGRGCLVICETIRVAELIGESIEKFKGVQVKLYTRNQENQEKYVEAVNPGDIIVATNLAGRGTDLKTTEVERHGGLHVCLTFLPDNQRVQDQALGRTSRQGNKGTGQLVIHLPTASPHESSMDSDCKWLIENRNQTERKTFDEFQTHQLQMIRTKDKLFEKFCDIFKEIRLGIRKKELSLFNRVARVVTNVHEPSVYEVVVLQAVEERWAMFLRQLDDGRLEMDKSEEEYESFEAELRRDNEKEKVEDGLMGENLYYFIRIGNHYLFIGKGEDAKTFYDTAINLDGKFAVGGYIGKAYLLLKGNYTIQTFVRHEDNYKERALMYLQKAVELLNQEMAQVAVVQMLTQRRHGTSSTLFQQLTQKSNILGTIVSNLLVNMANVEKSLRRVYVTCHNQNLKQVHMIHEKTLREKPRQLPTTLNGMRGYDLSFHSLSMMDDSGTRDQAVKTLKAIPKDIPGAAEWYSLACRDADLSVMADCRDLMQIKSTINIEVRDVELDQLKIYSAVPSTSFAMEVGATKEDLSKTLLSSAFSQATRNCTVELQLIVNGAESHCTILNFSSLPHIDVKRERLEAILRDKRTQDLSFKVSGMLTISGVLQVAQSCQFTPASVALTMEGVRKDWKTMKSAWADVLSLANHNTITFTELSHKRALNLIPELRKLKIDFILTCHNFSLRAAVEAQLGAADLKQEKIVMSDSEIREIERLPQGDQLCFFELNDLRVRGLQYLATFNEGKFVPWVSLAGVVALAALQASAGAALIGTGFGLPWGTGLIFEGLSDVVTVYRIYTTREFSWSNYRIQKAMGLALMAATAGFSALKEAAKAVPAITRGVVEEVAKHPGIGSNIYGLIAVLVTGKAMNTIANTTTTTTLKNLRSVISNQVRISVQQADQMHSQIDLKSLADSLTDFRFEQIQDAIAGQVMASVVQIFEAAEFKRLFGYYYATNFDEDQVWEMSMVQRSSTIVNGILNSTSAEWTSEWDAIGLTLHEELLNAPKFLETTWTRVTMACEFIARIDQIPKVVLKLCQQIQLTLDKQKPTLEILLFERTGLSKRAATVLATECKNNEKNDKQGVDFPTVDLSRVSRFVVNEDKGKEINKFVTALREKQQMFVLHGTEAMGGVLKALVDAITDQIVKIANSHLGSPIIPDLASAMMTKISEGLHSQFMGSGVGQTTGIAAETALVCQAREIISKTMIQQSKGKELSKVSPRIEAKVNEILGSAHADIATLYALAATNNLNIKILQSYNYSCPEYDSAAAATESGHHILVIQVPQERKEEGGDTIDGFVLVPATGDSIIFHGPDSGFEVIGHLTGKSANQLRVEACLDFLDKPDEFQEILYVCDWLQYRGPQEVDHNVLRHAHKGSGVHQIGKS